MKQSHATTIILGFVLAAAIPAWGAATVDEAENVCRNWLVISSSDDEGWNGVADPEIARTSPVLRGGDVLGWHFEIHPTGYVIVPAHKELPPIHACSETATWDEGAENPFLVVTRDALGVRFDQLRSDAADETRIHAEHEAWARYELEPERFVEGLEAKVRTEDVEVGPLLSTRWHQDWPFNLDCPMGEGQRTYVGCTATATAQIMKHHAWPPRGFVTTGYQWDGDDCAETPVGAWLEVDLTVPYPWDAMPDAVTPDITVEEREALARLSYEVAVACRMDFGSCGSAASGPVARAALMDLFRYRSIIREVVRFRFSTDAWFDEIRDDIDQGSPILYSTVIHTMVCDGWREVGGLKQIHLNYGWGGASDNWYSLDGIETSLNPTAERMILDIIPDRALPIEPDPSIPDDDPVATRLLPPAPNPANPRSVIAFTLTEPGPVLLEILDSRGRRVRSLSEHGLSAGSHARAWNGRTDAGRAAPSGVYFVRFEAGDIRETRKLLLAR